MLLPAFFDSQYTCTEPTAFRLNQSFWSWFKNTGRGYTIHTLTDRATAPLFTVETRLSGKYRVFKDGQGNHLCHLQRNFSSKKEAWILTRGEGEEKETLFSVHYDYLGMKLGITLNPAAASWNGDERGFETESSAGVQLQTRSLNMWGSTYTVTLGDMTVMRMTCTNMMHNAPSSFKVTPPKWDVDVVEEINLVLAATLAVVVSDSFSEMHLYMV
ncbi:uncharacterized protein BDV17DRAFT_248269 [Aspergillus undulatus]|uniref:uncharacterized protein n=1 Tax=Aspergillus undulatus TaxID=1810928 RepID=UPI003CCD06E5